MVAELAAPDEGAGARFLGAIGDRTRAGHARLAALEAGIPARGRSPSPAHPAPEASSAARRSRSAGGRGRSASPNKVADDAGGGAPAADRLDATVMSALPRRVPAAAAGSPPADGEDEGLGAQAIRRTNRFEIPLSHTAPVQPGAVEPAYMVPRRREPTPPPPPRPSSGGSGLSATLAAAAAALKQADDLGLSPRELVCALMASPAGAGRFGALGAAGPEDGSPALTGRSLAVGSPAPHDVMGSLLELDSSLVCVSVGVPGGLRCPVSRLLPDSACAWAFAVGDAARRDMEAVGISWGGLWGTGTVELGDSHRQVGDLSEKVVWQVEFRDGSSPIEVVGQVIHVEGATWVGGLMGQGVFVALGGGPISVPPGEGNPYVLLGARRVPARYVGGTSGAPPGAGLYVGPVWTLPVGEAWHPPAPSAAAGICRADRLDAEVVVSTGGAVVEKVNLETDGLRAASTGGRSPAFGSSVLMLGVSPSAVADNTVVSVVQPAPVSAGASTPPPFRYARGAVRRARAPSGAAPAPHPGGVSSPSRHTPVRARVGPGGVRVPACAGRSGACVPPSVRAFSAPARAEPGPAPTALHAAAGGGIFGCVAATYASAVPVAPAASVVSTPAVAGAPAAAAAAVAVPAESAPAVAAAVDVAPAPATVALGASPNDPLLVRPAPGAPGWADPDVFFALRPGVVVTGEVLAEMDADRALRPSSSTSVTRAAWIAAVSSTGQPPAPPPVAPSAADIISLAVPAAPTCPAASRPAGPPGRRKRWRRRGHGPARPKAAPRAWFTGGWFSLLPPTPRRASGEAPSSH